MIVIRKRGPLWVAWAHRGDRWQEIGYSPSWAITMQMADGFARGEWRP